MRFLIKQLNTFSAMLWHGGQERIERTGAIPSFRFL